FPPPRFRQRQNLDLRPIRLLHQHRPHSARRVRLHPRPDIPDLVLPHNIEPVLQVKRQRHVRRQHYAPAISGHGVGSRRGHFQRIQHHSVPPHLELAAAHPERLQNLVAIRLRHVVRNPHRHAHIRGLHQRQLQLRPADRNPDGLAAQPARRHHNRHFPRRRNPARELDVDLTVPYELQTRGNPVHRHPCVAEIGWIAPRFRFQFFGTPATRRQIPPVDRHKLIRYQPSRPACRQNPLSPNKRRLPLPPHACRQHCEKVTEPYTRHSCFRRRAAIPSSTRTQPSSAPQSSLTPQCRSKVGQSHIFLTRKMTREACSCGRGQSTSRALRVNIGSPSG